MSRVGQNPIPVPENVQVNIDKRSVSVSGPKGELFQSIPASISVREEEEGLVVSRSGNGYRARSLHGLTRSLIANMVVGVTDGFSKTLVIRGTGYRAALSGNNLVLTVGYSHLVEFPIPDNIEIETPSQTRIVVKGADKQRVGQVAAEIRKVRPPEPYHGYGIRYEGEYVRMKEGKSAAGV